MESHRKPISPTWDEIIKKSREEVPPEIDVRPHVRARVERELRLSVKARPDPAVGMLDGVIEMFSKPFARISLGACLGLSALLAITTTSTVEVTELTGNEIEVVENFDEALTRVDWTEYL
jgi:hypothetical protein